MPTAIVWAVNYLAVAGAISVGTAVAIGTFVATYGAALLFVGAMAYSSYKEKQAKEDAKNQYNASQIDRLVNVTSAIAPRELVLGRVRKGGTVFYKGSTGANQRDLYLAIALAGHEIDGIEGIYLADELVTLDGSGYVQQAPYSSTVIRSGAIGTGAGYTAALPSTYVPGTAYATYQGLVQGNEGADYYSSLPTSISVTGLTATAGHVESTISYQYYETPSYVQIFTHSGAAGQVADSALRAAFPSDWLAANVVQGVAYVVAKLSYSETAFPSGAPAVTVVMRGAKVYDPRTGLTAWSDNPALLMRHVYTHADFGKATPTAAEDARFVTAANACDTSTAYTVGGIVDTQKLYRAALVGAFGTPSKSLFDDLAQAMGGSWCFAGGEIYLKAGVYTAPVMDLGEDDLATIQRDGASETQRPMSIGVHKARADKFNTCKVQIWDQAQDCKQVSLTPLVGESLKTRDGAELVQELTFPAIGYAPQALHVAGVVMRDARDPMTIEFAAKLRAYPLEIFDTVTLTLARYGFAAKTFMLLSRSWAADGTLMLSFKETTAAITQVDAGFLAQGFARNTNLPKPWEVAAVGPLTIESGTNTLVKQADGTIVSRARVTFPQIIDAAVINGGKIEVQSRLQSSSGEWTTILVEGVDTSATFSNVTDREIYLFRARGRTSTGVGDWSIQVAHQVLGKTEPPSGVANLTVDGTRLAWTPVDDIDLAGYLLRYQYGSNTEWGTANLLHDGILTNSPYVMRSVPPGVVTIMVKAVDTTGNESLSPAYVIVNLGDSLVDNVVESIDYKAAAWSGTTSNTTLVSGNLQATQSDPFYRADASDFYGIPANDFYSNNFDGLVWESAGWTPSFTGAGHSMTASWGVTGDAVKVQYRQTGAELFYSSDAGLFYAEDSVRFYSSPPDWQSWPGSIVAQAQEYQWRVTTSTGPTSGLLSAFTVSVDVPDKSLSLNSIAIAPGGTRLAASIGQFNVIENIQLTIQGGGTATLLEINDKSNTLGPLITAKNSAGTSVSATIDALLQGY